jgi:anti-anti-sigma factor
MNMQISTQVQKNSYVIALSGSLDAENTAIVQHALLDSLQYHPKEVMVDCEDLCEVSPNSLKPFISTIRNLQKNHVGVVLIGVNQQLNSLFSNLGLNAFTRQISSSSLISSDSLFDFYFQEL